MIRFNDFEMAVAFAAGFIFGGLFMASTIVCAFFRRPPEKKDLMKRTNLFGGEDRDLWR